MNHKEFFGCKYPIIAASMNQVSDLKLAIACHNAGILPSLPIYSYSTNNYHIDYDTLNSVLTEFKETTGSNNIMITASRGDLLSDDFLNFILTHSIKFIEVIGNDQTYRRPEKPELFKEYLNANIKIIPKVTSSSVINPKITDAVILKSKDGAGRGIETIDVLDELSYIKNNFPSLPVIMSGGIGSKTDVKKYLNLGCMAVSIGTLLAASEESSISLESKEQMIKASSKDIQTFKNGAYQNAIIFSEVEYDDINHTQSLIEGIKNPNKGHIFVGKGIDNISSIRPVKDIVQELVDGL